MEVSEKSDRFDLVWPLIYFTFTVAVAYLMDWQATDLIWGLWLSSLLVGGFQITVSIAKQSKPYFKKNIALGIISLIFLYPFMGGFFAVHFGLFHLIHAMFLNAIFPLPEASGLGFNEKGPVLSPLLVLGAIKGLFITYWPFVLATLASRWKNFFGESKFGLYAPYVNVVKIHIMLFVFMALKASGFDHKIMLYAILLAFFFPWSLRGKHLKK